MPIPESMPESLSDFIPESIPRTNPREWEMLDRIRPHERNAVAPPSPGTHVPYSQETYARTWEPTAAEAEAERAATTARRAADRERYAPIMRKAPGSLQVLTSRPSKVNPLGRVTGIAIHFVPPRAVEPPTGLMRVLKRVVDEEVTIRVSHSRGYDLDAKGDPKREPIWEIRTPDENDDRTRVEIGRKDPEPVDSWVLRLEWPLGTDTCSAVLIGTWVGAPASPDFFLAWEPDAGTRVLADVTTFTAALDALLRGQNVADGLTVAESAKDAAAARRAARKADVSTVRG